MFDPCAANLLVRDPLCVGQHDQQMTPVQCVDIVIPYPGTFRQHEGIGDAKKILLPLSPTELEDIPHPFLKDLWTHQPSA